MEKLFISVLVMGMAAGAYAAESGPGALEVYPGGPAGRITGGDSPGWSEATQGTDQFSDLAVHASDLKTRDEARGVPVKTFEMPTTAVTAEHKIIDEPPGSAENTQ
ncbi:MAG: hypothetical protein NTX59_00680 [Elusimicrobia bacterium]|nr:hypothetical protein [Elusimicrobiota bacterium]